jgi:Ser/Thr protein kinase RdoA (MazF antagonist)
MICNPDEEHFYEIGKSYRKLHNLKLPSDLTQKIPKLDSNTLNESWSFLKNSKHMRQDQIKQLEDYKEESLKHLVLSSNNLVHFDLHDGNIIYTSKGICLLDWEECATGNGIFDLAVTNTRLVKLKEESTLRKALLKGYGETDLTQLKYATIFKFLYLTSFVAKFEDVLIGGETLENLLDRYLSYFRKLEKDQRS